MSARTKPKHHRRRTGCYTCRERKKRCDEEFDPSGSCRTCVRLRLDCYAPRNAHFTAASPHNSDIVNYCHVNTTDQAVSNIFGAFPGNVPREQVRRLSSPIASSGYILRPALSTIEPEYHREDRELVQYFINHLISKRTVIPVEQSGLYMLISRAFHQPELMAALLASASAHQMQCMLQTDANDFFERRARREYGRALSRLSQYLQSGAVDFERATTSAVLLTFTDIILGGTSEWYHHLQGAIAIVNGARDKLDPRNVVFHRFLTRFLIYHDVVAAVAMSTSTALDPVFYQQEEQQIVSENLHSISGANSMLLTLIARICRLRAMTNRSTPAQFGPLYIEANDIEQRLHATKACSSSGLLFEHLLEIYRASALCLLYRTLERLKTSAPLIDTMKIKGNTCHENLITCLQRVPFDSTLGPALVFPLFIAGVGATTAGQQTFIHNQMKGLYDRLRFGNIARTLLVLEDVWNSRVACERLGWTSSIQRRSWKLALA